MRVDGNIGGAIDGTGGGDLAGIAEQVGAAERVGYDGVWTTEVSRDPFLPLLLAADRSRTLTLGTAIAVAFARNPMTVAMVANDLQSFSSGRFVLGLGSQIKATSSGGSACRGPSRPPGCANSCWRFRPSGPARLPRH